METPPANNPNPPASPEASPERKPLQSLSDHFALKFESKEFRDPKQDEGKQEASPKEPENAAPPVKEPPAPAKKPATKPVEGLSDPDSFRLENTKGKQVTESFRKVTAELKTAHEIIHKREARIAELESTLGNQKTKWEEDQKKLTSEVETLRGYRMVTDEQNTPEFQEKFDKPITSAQNEIKAILKGLGVKEEEFVRFLPNIAAMENIAQQVEDAGHKTQSRLLMDSIEDLAKAQRKRESAIEDFKANHQKIVEARKSELTATKAQEAQRAQKHLETQLALKDEKGGLKYAFFNEIKVAPDATPEQQAHAEKHNEFVGQVRAQMVDLLGRNSPEENAEKVIGTMLASIFYSQLQNQIEKVKSLEGELQKISSSGRAPNSPNPSRGDQPTIKRGTSLAEAFDMMTARR